MLNSLKRNYSRVQRVINTDDYNQDIVTYTPSNDIQMIVSLLTHEDYTQNNLNIKQATHLGLTFDEVTIGDIIGDQYTVEYINKAGKEHLVYLKELQGNGIFC